MDAGHQLLEFLFNSVKLKERRNFQVISRMRDILMESDRDIGVLLDPKFFNSLVSEFSQEEVLYAFRYLTGKGYIQKDLRTGAYSLSVEGYEEWLFPTGVTNSRAIFLSHASEDRGIAIQIKKRLEPDFSVFVAHDDIEPGALFRDRLISELQTCGVFMALRTKNYQKKSYTEQECGWALALNKRIISLCIGISPKDMGLCSDIQGKKFEKNVDINSLVDYCKKQLG